MRQEREGSRGVRAASDSPDVGGQLAPGALEQGLALVSPGRKVRWCVAIAAAGISLAGCGDAPTRPDGLALSTLTSAELIDPLINENDTYLITLSVSETRSTMVSAEPFVDPATGRTVTELELPVIVDSVRAEAGYDASGSVRMSEYLVTNEPGAEPTRIRIAGGVATVSDARTEVVDEVASPILTDMIGNMADIVVTDEAVLYNEQPESDGLTNPEAVPSAAVSGHQATSTAARVATSRSERRGDRLVRTDDLDDPLSGTKGTRVREFRVSRGAWVLAEERSTTEAISGKVTTRTVETIRYPLVKWASNKQRDEARRTARAGRPSREDGPPSHGFDTIHGLSSIERRYATPDDGSTVDPDGGTDTSGTGSGGGTDTSGTGTQPNPSPAPNGLNLVFQHDALYTASAWATMQPLVRGRYPAGTTVKPTLDWKKPLESQASTLNQAVLATGATDFLMIGHGNGGLISRRAGQNGSGSPGSLVTGVVTIASGHQGLPLAANSRRIVHEQLTSAFTSVLDRMGGSCWRVEYEWLCREIEQAMRRVVPNATEFALDAVLTPMSADVKPESKFLTDLNARPEGFQKLSLEVHSRGSWKFMRMFGDLICEPRTWCDGNTLANVTESAHKTIRACGSNIVVRVLNEHRARKCRNVRQSMSNLNGIYERLTAGADPKSDGLVPGESQKYPGVEEQNRRVIPDSRVSHFGELKDPSVGQRLVELVDRYKTF